MLVVAHPWVADAGHIHIVIATRMAKYYEKAWCFEPLNTWKPGTRWNMAGWCIWLYMVNLCGYYVDKETVNTELNCLFGA